MPADRPTPPLSGVAELLEGVATHPMPGDYQKLRAAAASFRQVEAVMATMPEERGPVFDKGFNFVHDPDYAHACTVFVARLRALSSGAPGTTPPAPPGQEPQ